MGQQSKHPTDPLRIILDSNALFVPLHLKIDIFEELEKLLKLKFELILLSPIKEELETMAKKGSPKMRKNASHALKMAEKCRLIEIDEEPTSSPDSVILQTARKWRSPVFTNDRRLRKMLRNINVPVIYVRQKSRLVINGRI